ncbi:hypothetical protein PVK06_035239 [Gossypium arboreum]|uniref:Uncharacterized protein n=1 Tax=Gossypium arboreum TaxID=29729 RepID=A0ABR0NGA1_GOSAR|nr:hypothetical protein PVK06_035239 [Gossypium arboreum]
MTSSSSSILVDEFQSISKPSYFNSVNYSYWKTRMMCSSKAVILPCGMSPWMVHPFLKSHAHSLYGLGPDEYSRVSLCSNAREIWDQLEVTHEGVNQVKKSNVGILTFNYENFMMKLEEDIKAMSDRFTIIIIKLKSYRKTYPNEEVTLKMLRNLPMSQDAKVTAIEEAKNLETLSLDELIGMEYGTRALVVQWRGACYRYERLQEAVQWPAVCWEVGGQEFESFHVQKGDLILLLNAGKDGQSVEAI